MWIKKIATSLYTSIMYRMIFSGLISLMIFFLLIIYSIGIVERQNLNFIENQKDDIIALVEDINNQIVKNKYTLEQARRVKFIDDDSPYAIYFFSMANELFNMELFIDDSIRVLNDAYVFDVSFQDGKGFVAVSSSTVEFTSNLYYILSGVVTVIIFFVMSIYLIFKQLSYIKVIEEGINNISDEDILYKIPIIGKNELARLAMSINDMGESLYDKMEKEREDEIYQRLLITNMSHDLRTPLTSIIGYIDIAKSKLDKESEVYPYIAVAKENGLRLERLINDLFLYSKLLSGDIPVNIQSIDINVMLRQIVEIKAENIKTNFAHKKCFANIDTEKFNRIIDNLISNAEKYGVKGKPIIISTHITDKYVFTEIRNTTNDDIETKISYLKNRMYTAKEDRANGSSGLGLSIVAELVKAMNGDLNLAYESGEFIAKIALPKSDESAQ